MSEINFNVEDIEEINLSMDVGIKKIYPPIENLEVTPTKEKQVFTHKNSYGYDNVTINPIPDEYIIPNGTLEVAENGDIDVTTFKTARVRVYTPPKLQTKEVTPTKEIQNITSDETYDGLNKVIVNAIPDNYIVPNGSLEITKNGTYNVKEYAETRVNVEGSGGGNIELPPEYQEVTYLQSNSINYNTNYIDTGVIPNNNTSIEAISMFYGLDYGRIYGSSNKMEFFVGASDRVAGAAKWGSDYVAVLPAVGFTNALHIVKQDKNKFYIDGALINTFTNNVWQDTHTLRLFSTSDGDRDSLLKMLSCKIWDDEILIRDFKPCYRKSDNAIGMYDLANDTFYQTQGTVEFSIGPEI